MEIGAKQIDYRSQFNSDDSSALSKSQSKNSKEEAKEGSAPNKSSSFNKCKCRATILLVGNSNYMQVQLKMLLKESFECEVMTALDGIEAVGLYQMSLNRDCQCCFAPFRLVITDLKLSLLGGQKAAEQMKSLQSAHNEATPTYFVRTDIIGISPTYDPHVTKACVKSGMV